MKLSELKTEVYRAAEVTTTKQLKAEYAEIKSLDMRRKASWEKVLALLNKSKKSAHKKSTSEKNKSKKADSQKESDQDKSGFEAWLSDPTNEYKSLFDQAESALSSIGEKLVKGQKITKTAKAMAEGLSEFADASLEEAQKLAKSARRSQDASKQADLN